MSKDAPWIALAIDWQDEPVFDDTNHGVRLAWVLLLCHTKRGRRGRFKASEFALRYRLDTKTMKRMVKLAYQHKHIRFGIGGRIIICNRRQWGPYKRKGVPKPLQIAVLARDGFMCRYCREPATTVDHIFPHSRGGLDHESNLVACCRKCNSKKGAKTPTEAGMKLLARSVSKKEQRRLVRPTDGCSCDNPRLG